MTTSHFKKMYTKTTCSELELRFVNSDNRNSVLALRVECDAHWGQPLSSRAPVTAKKRERGTGAPAGQVVSDGEVRPGPPTGAVARGRQRKKPSTQHCSQPDPKHACRLVATGACFKIENTASSTRIAVFARDVEHRRLER